MEINSQQSFRKISLFAQQLFKQLRFLSTKYDVEIDRPKQSAQKVRAIFMSGQLEDLAYYFDIVEQIKDRIGNIEQEYQKLETLVQKYQTQIRQRVGIQQQLRLYIDVLSSQIEQGNKKNKMCEEKYKKQINKYQLENKRLNEQFKKVSLNKSISNTFSFQKKSYVNVAHKNLTSNKRIRDRSKTNNFCSIDSQRVHTYQDDQIKPQQLDFRNQIQSKLRKQVKSDLKKKHPKFHYNQFSYKKINNTKNLQQSIISNHKNNHKNENISQEMINKKSGRKHKKGQHSVHSDEHYHHSIKHKRQLTFEDQTIKNSNCISFTPYKM